MPLYTNEKYRRARFLPSPFFFFPAFLFGFFSLLSFNTDKWSEKYGFWADKGPSLSVRFLLYFPSFKPRSLSLVLNPCLSRGEYKRKRHFRQGWMHCLRQPLTERLNFTAIFLTLPFPFLLSPSKDECLQGGKGFSNFRKCRTGKWRLPWSTPVTLPTIRRSNP